MSKNKWKVGTRKWEVCRAIVRAIMVAFSIVALTSGGGCAAYTEAEHELAEQARKGLALVRLAQVDHVAVAGRLGDAQRQRLDDAFDADVKETSNLSPDWVIEHRRAYVTGLDALNTQRAASANAAQTAARTLEAAERALQQLQRLQKARQKLESVLTPEQK